ncbi:hypothetical protein DAPPUDRAFT_107977 [Daphnia pulex]|uniref:Uncharacterized protein n=1 Tax=Daphnia pulex TaxID=6669 RepID=E9GYR4_DAPPU|nr:hypothetical protein DAPPUDRAFT_107977 [Daphnia pulex]|eukprot:EFX75366.1 hypothetical protein DAPPUDRAFT_107977 [Daphnia pulex]
MEELPMILTIIAEMLTDEDVEIQVGIQELAAMLPQRELFLKRNRGPTDFVGITEYVKYTVNSIHMPKELLCYDSSMYLLKNWKFTSLSTGWPGSMPDASVFQNSAIGRQIHQILEVDGTDEDDEYEIKDEEEQKDEDLDHNERFSGKVYRERISSMLEY